MSGQGEQRVVERTEELSTGEDSPLARIYDLHGWVFLLGVGHDSNTSLHLAEYRADFPSKRVVRCGAPLSVEGRREWVYYQDLDIDADDFERIGTDFARETGLVQAGRVA